jgi:hypothetical protein
MSNINRLPSVPTDYASRKVLWIRSGQWLSANEGPFLTLSVQDLGYAERCLLEMEQRIAGSALARAERETLIMECAAHSKLWILGLYEIVRIVKNANAPKFNIVGGLFHELEILRIPLAKHEVKSAAKYRKSPHYPTGIWDPESGRVGWHVFDPIGETMKTLTRTSIANEFLSLTATEPLCPAIPIGGPLGRPDHDPRSDRQHEITGPLPDRSATLKDLSQRLARELADLPDHDAVTDVFDCLAGAIFSLKQCADLPFWERKGRRLKGYKTRVSQYSFRILDGESPSQYWVSGYFVNSAMLRIAACCDRIPKMILKKDAGNAHASMEALCGKDNERDYKNWKTVYKEVNKIKHDASALAFGRYASKSQVIAALEEIVSTLEAKKIDIRQAYGSG